MLLARTAASIRDILPPLAEAGPGDVLGGGFLEVEPPAALDVGAADRALARIDAFDALETRAAARLATRGLGELMTLPEPVREAAFGAILEGRGFGFAGFGIRRLTLPTPGEARVDILRIEPGYGVAGHDHEGEEFTLVMTGAFNDGHQTYRPGDINVGQPGFVHEPKALPGVVCYALAVSYGSPAFEGPVGLLQKLTGFGR